MKIVNLTPHPVVVLRDDENGNVVGSTGVGTAAKEGKFTLVATLAPAGTVARAVQQDKSAGQVEIVGTQVPVIRSTFSAPTDLPEAEAGTCFVVSVITAQAAKASGRATDDLLITADPVRDVNGKIVGCRKFAVL